MRESRSLTFSVALAWGSMFSLASMSTLADEPPVDFNRDIRPILSENCFFCHGPDANNRQADLRLDVRDDAVDAGAITPGELDASELVARLHEEDPDLRMPPKDSHKSLDPEQIRLLERWIESGAEYQQHWSFSPRVRPDVPQPPSEWSTDLAEGLPATPSDWIKNPIDAFVLRQLHDQGVDPSPVASPERLRRRLTLDLVGFPLFDDQAPGSSPREYEQLVEHLFQSPHHGERMASAWLDVVRYADTVGYHGDQTQNIFPYRDWVVDSINRNVPFDQFTIAQLAGDLLPTPTDADRIASGFNRLNMMTREGGAQPGEYLAKYAADRVRTVGMAWMGLTTGCAECHDHKFDPFSAKDFYSLAAYFDDVKQWGVYSDYGYTPNPELRGGNNDYPFYPEHEVFSSALLRRQQAFLNEMMTRSEAFVQKWTKNPSKEKQLNDFASRISDWVQDHPTGWKTVPPARVEGADRLDRVTLGGSVVLKDATPPQAPPEKKQSKEKPAKHRDFKFGSEGWMSPRSMRIQFFGSSNSPDGGIMRNDANAPKLSFKFFREDALGKRSEIAVRRSDANRRHPDHSSTLPVLDITSRWKVPRHRSDGTLHPVLDLSRDSSQPLTAVFQFRNPVVLAEGESLVVRLDGSKPAHVSFAFSPLPFLRPFDIQESTSWVVANDRSTGFPAIHAAMALSEDFVRSELQGLETEYRRCRDGFTPTMVTESTDPKTTRVLPRGNWQDESGDIVQPATPEFLGTWDESSTGRPSRLDLAHWIVHPNNPLTARVVVNRWWKHFFGTGLSASADDLGAQGQPPSHPELLDWLASELIDSGWDRRHILRLIVNSNVYRQDSRVREELLDRDPNNRWLAHHPPRRLEAEAVRDHALAVAGLLNREIGGPPVRPYQPAGYYSNLQFPNRVYQASRYEDQYRRGIYMHWQRTFLHPMLANFDAPSREDCVAMRALANTPQQALTLLNDPTFVEAAKSLAIWTLRNTGDDEQRLRAMIRRALQRKPSEPEIQRFASFLSEQRKVYQQDTVAAEDLLRVGSPSDKEDLSALPLGKLTGPERNAEVAAWTATARVLINLHESITRY